MSTSAAAISWRISGRLSAPSASPRKRPPSSSASPITRYGATWSCFRRPFRWRRASPSRPHRKSSGKSPRAAEVAAVARIKWNRSQSHPWWSPIWSLPRIRAGVRRRAGKRRWAKSRGNPTSRRRKMRRKSRRARIPCPGAPIPWKPPRRPVAVGRRRRWPRRAAAGIRRIHRKPEVSGLFSYVKLPM